MICHAFAARDRGCACRHLNLATENFAVRRMLDFMVLESLSFAAVAQLDRVLGYEPRGRGFNSCQPHQYHNKGGVQEKSCTPPLLWFKYKDFQRGTHHTWPFCVTIPSRLIYSSKASATKKNRRSASPAFYRHTISFTLNSFFTLASGWINIAPGAINFLTQFASLIWRHLRAPRSFIRVSVTTTIFPLLP